MIIIRDQAEADTRHGAYLLWVYRPAFDRRSHDPLVSTSIAFHRSRCLTSLNAGQLGVGLRGRRPFIRRAGAVSRCRPINFRVLEDILQDQVEAPENHSLHSVAAVSMAQRTQQRGQSFVFRRRVGA